MAYAEPAHSLAQMATLVANQTGLDATNDATLIYQAMTEAANTAATWQRRGWWWSLAYNTFDTVATTKSYNLRTVNTNAMQALYAPLSLIDTDNDVTLTIVSKQQYDAWNATLTDTGSPLYYAMAGALTAYLWPTPSDAYTIGVSYIQRHSKISATSGASDLLVPGEFMYGVYVGGAVSLIKAEALGDPTFLIHDDRFRKVMRGMAIADPREYDPNSPDRNPTGIPGVPPNTHVSNLGDGMFWSKGGLTLT